MNTEQLIGTLLALIKNDTRKVSIALIQRKMEFGYSHAVEVMEELIRCKAIINPTNKEYELAPEIVTMSELSIARNK